MNTFRRSPPGPDDCQVCSKPLPESRRYGRLCGYICTATAKHRRLPASTWKEWVAKDCVICNSPVPFERIYRYPRTLTCGEVCSIRNEQRGQKRAHKKWRRKRQALARALTLARQAAEGVAYSTPWAGRAWNKPITGSAMLGAASSTTTSRLPSVSMYKADVNHGCPNLEHRHFHSASPGLNRL